MKKYLLPLSIFSCLSVSLITPVTADEVMIPVGQQGADKAAIARPTVGISKEVVRERFGDPKEWTDPVGEPPISSWEYQDFIVYFEHDLVLHSVLKLTVHKRGSTQPTEAPSPDQNNNG